MAGADGGLTRYDLLAGDKACATAEALIADLDGLEIDHFGGPSNGPAPYEGFLGALSDLRLAVNDQLVEHRRVGGLSR